MPAVTRGWTIHEIGCTAADGPLPFSNVAPSASKASLQMEESFDLFAFYRRRAAKLPNGGPLADRAKETWKLFYPKMYAELRDAGVLDDAANVAAANYQDLYSRLVEQGADAYAAQEWAAHDCFGSGPIERDELLELELGEEIQLGAFEKWLDSLPEDDGAPNDGGKQAESDD